MISTVILVHAEFDIARGCKLLRSYVAAQRWKPVFGARATAAMTALGDLILSSGTNALVPINITVVNAGDHVGIELGCNLYLPGSDRPEILEAKQRLARATSAIDVYETAGNFQITACLYVEGN